MYNYNKKSKYIINRILEGVNIRQVLSEGAANDKYILLTHNAEQLFDDFDSAKKAYDECSDVYKFLYQPDKTYFVGTLTSTGSVIGHDHRNHRDVVKCVGLFMAKNKNQISKFLEKAGWYHQGSSGSSSKARLYGNGPYGSLYQSNTDLEQFKQYVQVYYLTSYNIAYPNKLESGFGAVDIQSYPANRMSNPYNLS